jgi:hypothetical protein
MTAEKSPGAVAALGAFEMDALERHVDFEINSPQDLAQAPIRAMLVGRGRCEAQGMYGSGSAPVLALCRKLIEAGFDPATPLEAWRGDTLALRVRSIGEGARLSVEDDRHGRPRFRRWRDRGYGEGSLIAKIEGSPPCGTRRARIRS